MTKHLLATRHCEAAPAAQDLDRVLTEAGEKAARALGKLPVFQEFAGAPLFGSEAVRTRQTLAHAFDQPIERIEIVTGLYPDPAMWPGKKIDEIYAIVKHAPLRAYLDADGGKHAMKRYGLDAAQAVIDVMYDVASPQAVIAWHGALIQATIVSLCQVSMLDIPDCVMDIPLEPGNGFVLEFDDDLLLKQVQPYYQ